MRINNRNANMVHIVKIVNPSNQKSLFVNISCIFQMDKHNDNKC